MCFLCIFYIHTKCFFDCILDLFMCVRWHHVSLFSPEWKNSSEQNVILFIHYINNSSRGVFVLKSSCWDFLFSGMSQFVLLRNKYLFRLLFTEILPTAADLNLIRFIIRFSALYSQNIFLFYISLTCIKVTHLRCRVHLPEFYNSSELWPRCIECSANKILLTVNINTNT